MFASMETAQVHFGAAFHDLRLRFSFIRVHLCPSVSRIVFVFWVAAIRSSQVLVDIRPKTPECDGVTQTFNGRDAVLIAPACLSFHDIDGARLQLDRKYVPLLLVWFKSHDATARERDADNGAEHRQVPVPADWGPGSVFR